MPSFSDHMAWERGCYSSYYYTFVLRPHGLETRLLQQLLLYLRSQTTWLGNEAATAVTTIPSFSDHMAWKRGCYSSYYYTFVLRPHGLGTRLLQQLLLCLRSQTTWLGNEAATAVTTIPSFSDHMTWERGCYSSYYYTFVLRPHGLGTRLLQQLLLYLRSQTTWLGNEAATAVTTIPSFSDHMAWERGCYSSYYYTFVLRPHGLGTRLLQQLLLYLRSQTTWLGNEAATAVTTIPSFSDHMAWERGCYSSYYYTFVLRPHGLGTRLLQQLLLYLRSQTTWLGNEAATAVTTIPSFSNHMAWERGCYSSYYYTFVLRPHGLGTRLLQQLLLYLRSQTTSHREIPRLSQGCDNLITRL